LAADFFHLGGKIGKGLAMGLGLLVHPSQLKKLPSFDLETFNRAAVMTPALSVMKEFLNGNADGDN